MKSSKLVRSLLRTSRRVGSPSSLSGRRDLASSSLNLHSGFCISRVVHSSLRPVTTSSFSSLPNRLFSSSRQEKTEYNQDTFQYEPTDDVEVIDEWEDEEEEGDAKIGDGGDGGGVVFQGVPWGERALSIAHEVLSNFDDDMEIYSFKTTPRGYIYVRLDKLTHEYGCPAMEDLERFSKDYKKRLDEAGAAREVPDDLALEVSSPGAERLLKVPEDLHRFKNMPMRVCYIEGTNLRSSEKTSVFMLESVENESEQCTWKLADVRENRDPQSKGRPLSRKQKDLRIKLPFTAHSRVTLYLD